QREGAQAVVLLVAQKPGGSMQERGALAGCGSGRGAADEDFGQLAVLRVVATLPLELREHGRAGRVGLARALKMISGASRVVQPVLTQPSRRAQEQRAERRVASPYALARIKGGQVGGRFGPLEQLRQRKTRHHVMGIELEGAQIIGDGAGTVLQLLRA